MRWDRKKLGLLLATLLLGIASTFAGSKDNTFVGTVSDSLCGAEHMMPGDAASCTRACVGKGSKYALVSGTKVYTLDTEDKAALAQLDKLAGQTARVTGTAKEDTIQVKSVAAGK